MIVDDFYLYNSMMKKTSESGKFPSFRQQMQKRPSAFDIHRCSLKPEIAQEIVNEVQPNIMSTTQTEIAKRIENKIRIKKTTESEKRISREGMDRGNNDDKHHEQSQIADLIEQFSAKVDYYWENSEKIGDLVKSLSSYIDPALLKQRLLADSGILRCQVAGQNAEELLFGRLKKLGELIKSEKRCDQRASHMQQMIEERMKKLSDLLKSR